MVTKKMYINHVKYVCFDSLSELKNTKEVLLDEFWINAIYIYLMGGTTTLASAQSYQVSLEFKLARANPLISYSASISRQRGNNISSRKHKTSISNKGQPHNKSIFIQAHKQHY